MINKLGHAAVLTQPPTNRDRIPGSYLPTVALLVLSGVAGPLQAQQPTPGSAVADVSYKDGQLRIDTRDANLADILTKIAAITGVPIDVPPSAQAERLHIVDLGPGPARQIVASLLDDASFDYVILASDSDASKIQSVLVMPREKRGPGGRGDVAATPQYRGLYARTHAPAVQTDDPRVPEVPPAPEPSMAAAEASPPAAADPDASTSVAAAQPDISLQSPRSRPDQPGLPRGPVISPPASMTPDVINNQLQQMYQQRMQILQQERQTIGSAAPPSPGSK